ncbi:MAG: NAD(P) transhydrogenase subunit alpha [Phycisphaerales bacterium]
MKLPVPALAAAAAAHASATACLAQETPAAKLVTAAPEVAAPAAHASQPLDIVGAAFVFMLATFIGIGVIKRVSRLLHTPLMSVTNAISAIAVVGAIIVAGGEGYPWPIRLMGSIALFASMTNIISGFMITDRMLSMFKSEKGVKP